jgi:hypothetical protein
MKKNKIIFQIVLLCLAALAPLLYCAIFYPVLLISALLASIIIVHRRRVGSPIPLWVG